LSINNEKIPLLPLALARSHKKRVHHGLQIHKYYFRIANPKGLVNLWG